jgi:hypothetical protein
MFLGIFDWLQWNLCAFLLKAKYFEEIVDSSKFKDGFSHLLKEKLFMIENDQT